MVSMKIIGIACGLAAGALNAASANAAVTLLLAAGGGGGGGNFREALLAGDPGQITTAGTKPFSGTDAVTGAGGNGGSGGQGGNLGCTPVASCNAGGGGGGGWTGAGGPGINNPGSGGGTYPAFAGGVGGEGGGGGRFGGGGGAGAAGGGGGGYSGGGGGAGGGGGGGGSYADASVTLTVTTAGENGNGSSKPSDGRVTIDGADEGVAGSIVTWTATQAGLALYDIVAYGAQGGGTTVFAGLVLGGGYGAAYGGDVRLRMGTVLDILVGQAGDNGERGGGGGGSFVWIVSEPPAVPEPSTWALIVLGFMGLGCIGRRGAKAALAGQALAV